MRYGRALIAASCLGLGACASFPASPRCESGATRIEEGTDGALGDYQAGILMIVPSAGNPERIEVVLGIASPGDDEWEVVADEGDVGRVGPCRYAVQPLVLRSGANASFVVLTPTESTRGKSGDTGIREGRPRRALKHPSAPCV